MLQDDHSKEEVKTETDRQIDTIKEDSMSKKDERKTFKTTKAHYEKFKANFENFVEEFGLFGWKIHFEHDEIEYDDPEEGLTLADITADLVGRNATVRMNIEWNHPPTDEAIENTAYHECCELMYSRIEELANARYLGSADLVREEVHNLIRIMERIRFGRKKNLDA